MGVLLLQLFWFSFAVIGAAELLVFARLRPNSQFIKYIFKTHPLVAALIAEAIGITSFGLIIVPSILFSLTITPLEVSYLIALTLTFLVFLSERNQIRRRLNGFKLTPRHLFLILSVGGILAAIYGLGLYMGGIPFGDAKFEIAQTTMFAQKHFSLSDPIFGSGGVPPTVYSFSFQHGLQALASNLLSRSATWVWFYSFSFFVLMILLSFFAVCWEFLPDKIRGLWSYSVLVMATVTALGVFEYAELHNRIVVAWTALFIIGIKLWLESRTVWLMAIASILLAASHPLNSFMAAVFLALLLIALIFFRLLPVQQSGPLLLILIILLLPMGLYFYYPHGITAAGFNDGPSTGKVLHLQRLGPFWINSLRPTFGWLALGVDCLLAVYLYTISRLTEEKYRSVRIISLVIVFLACLLVYDPVLLSLIGYLYLAVKTKDKSVRISLVLLFIFLGLLIYNPIFLGLMKGRLPIWTISRFADFNVIAFFATLIGLLCIAYVPLEKWGYQRLAAWSTGCVVAVYIFLVPLFYPISGSALYSTHNLSANRDSFNHLDQLKSFRPQLRNQMVFSDNFDLMALIPTVVPSNVLLIDNEANVNPAVHIKQRQACANSLRFSLNPQNLTAAGITAIITNSSPDSRFGKLLTGRPDIILTTKGYGYRVYRVLEIDKVRPGNVCSIPPPSSG